MPKAVAKLVHCKPDCQDNSCVTCSELTERALTRLRNSRGELAQLDLSDTDKVFKMLATAEIEVLAATETVKYLKEVLRERGATVDPPKSDVNVGAWSC